MQSLATSAKASSATAPAAAADRTSSSPSSPSSASAASHATPRACSVATSMSAHRCFTPWNWPIGRPNCRRTAAYSAAVSTHHPAPPAASAATSAAARWSTCAAIETWQLVQRRNDHAVEREARHPARGIQRLERRRRPRRAAHHAPALLAVYRDRHHDYVGEGPAQHRARGARDDDRSIASRLPIERRAVRHAADRAATGELGEQPAVAAARVDGGTGPHRGQERAGRAGPPERFEDHGQLGEAVALAAHVLRQVETEPSEPDQVVPERRERLVGRIDGRAYDGRSTPRIGEPADGVVQREVVVADGNGHAAPSPSRCLTIVSR